MFQVSWPSLKSLNPFSGEKRVFEIAPVKSFEIENAQEKPARALKHLLKLNHANYAILYNERKFHNHAPHVCLTSGVYMDVGVGVDVADACSFLHRLSCRALMRMI